MSYAAEGRDPAGQNSWEVHLAAITNKIQQRYQQIVSKSENQNLESQDVGKLDTIDQQKSEGLAHGEQHTGIKDGQELEWLIPHTESHHKEGAESFLGKRMRTLKEAFSAVIPESMIYNPRKPNDYEEVIRKRELEASLKLQQAAIGDSARLEQKLEEIALAKQKVSSDIAALTGATKPIAEDPTSFVDKKIIKMMEKFGWEQGQGIGLNNNGLLNPLIPQKISAHAAVIVPSEPQLGAGSKPQAAEAAKPQGPVRQLLFQSQAVVDDPRIAPIKDKYFKNLHKATKVVLLQNTITQKQATPAVKAELEESAREFGDVVAVDYQKMGRNEDNPQALRIFLVFERREHAAFCKLHFNNAKLSSIFGAQVTALGVPPLSKAIARFYPEEAYSNKVFTK